MDNIFDLRIAIFSNIKVMFSNNIINLSGYILNECGIKAKAKAFM